MTVPLWNVFLRARGSGTVGGRHDVLLLPVVLVRVILPFAPFCISTCVRTWAWVPAMVVVLDIDVPLGCSGMGLGIRIGLATVSHRTVAADRALSLASAWDGRNLHTR